MHQKNVGSFDKYEPSSTNHMYHFQSGLIIHKYGINSENNCANMIFVWIVT